MGYDGSLKFDTKLDESGFNSGIQKLGSIAKGGIAIIGSAVAGGIAAFGAITKASLDSVASLEQNVGGIETLFGAGGQSIEDYAASVGKSIDEIKDEYDALIKAQETALGNADEAYKTAGLSANEYMETVTSIAAALKQSVDSELEAAEAADQAIIDMSDNANKMGTSMESIQNAYQGFAKQNYTMLDNLKLGYGGTKEEMERLLKDAEKLSGVEYDIDNLADVYEAIHVIQTEIGITGTTAKEAATTIEGSMSSAKAAWDNFLSGTGTAEEFADAVGVAADVVIQNLGEIIPRLVESIPKAVGAIWEQFTTAFEENGDELIQVGINLIQSILNGISTSLPQIIAGALKIIESLLLGIQSSMPAITTGALQIIESLLSGIIQLLPQILEMGIQLIIQLANGIAQALPELIPQAVNCILSLVDTFINNIDQLVDCGINLLIGLAEGIGQAIPDLLLKAPIIITKLSAAIIKNLPRIITSGIEIIGSLATGILKAVPNMISQIPGIVSKIVSGFKNTDWKSVGINIIDGIAGGIINSASKVLEAAKDAAKKALQAAKDFLGIKSPSRRFRDEVGKMMAEGMGIGFEENIPVDNIENGVDGIVNKATKRLSIVNSRVPDSMNSIVNRVTNNYTGNSIDYRKLKEAQRQAMNEANQKPVVLNGRVLNRELRTGGLVTV